MQIKICVSWTVFILTPLLESTLRKLKSLGLHIVFASGHDEMVQIHTDWQRVSPPGPLTGLQAFSQLDHTKELPVCSCLSQDKYRNALLCSPFIRLCLYKHRCLQSNFYQLCIEYSKEQQWSQHSIHCLNGWEKLPMRDHKGEEKKITNICLLNSSTATQNTCTGEKIYFLNHKAR